MNSYFENKCSELYEKTNNIVNNIEVFKANRAGIKLEINFPKELENEFSQIVNKVNFYLMEEHDNFYGYFLFQMGREIRFDIRSATAVNFKGAKYVIYFNPLIFLQLTLEQMKTTIKHEILHILSFHLVRAKELKEKYSTLAINLAMDVVVNQYLDHLPPFSSTLKSVNLKYNLKLEPYNTFEYYVVNIQNEIDLLEEDDEGDIDDSKEMDNIENDFDPEKTHDMWDENNEIDEKTIRDFTEKFVDNAEKGTIPAYVTEMIAALRNNKGELPWNLYLKRIMGTLESNKKKTVTRRNRRQPDRLDLRGEIRSHKAQIAVAIDISGSISDEEFKQAIKEILSIVKNYNDEITIIECDNEIKRAYKVKAIKDIKERATVGGGTKFTPVFKYANRENINLLIYFTDGKGEERLEVMPRGYKILWVICGRGEELSLKQHFGAIKKLSNIEIKEDTIDMHDVKTDGYSMNNQEPLY